MCMLLQATAQQQQGRFFRCIMSQTTHTLTEHSRSIITLTSLLTLPADYNATTPIYPEVTAAMQPFTSQQFGNPSSVHTYGLATRTAVDKARQQVAALINCWADELAFTSCGTEADNWAIWGSVMARKDTVEGTPHVVTSAVEHPAVTKCLQQLQQLVSRAVDCCVRLATGRSCITIPAAVLVLHTARAGQPAGINMGSSNSPWSLKTCYPDCSVPQLWVCSGGCV